MTTVSEKQIPLLDLREQHKQVREEVLAEIVRVVDSQKFILGEDVPEARGGNRFVLRDEIRRGLRLRFGRVNPGLDGPRHPPR